VRLTNSSLQFVPAETQAVNHQHVRNLLAAVLLDYHANAEDGCRIARPRGGKFSAMSVLCRTYAGELLTRLVGCQP